MYQDENHTSMDVQNILTNSGHSSFLPGGIRHMSEKELGIVFGQTTIQNYHDDHGRKCSKTFRQDARGILARIRRMDVLFKRILIAQTEISTLFDTVDKAHFPSSFASGFERLCGQELFSQDLLAMVTDGILNDYLDDANQDCRQLSRQVNERAEPKRKNLLYKLNHAAKEVAEYTNPYKERNIELTRRLTEARRAGRAFLQHAREYHEQPVKPVEKNLGVILRSLAELSVHARIFANPKDAVPETLLTIESIRKGNSPRRVGFDAMSNQLTFAKRVAATGMFSLEDILFEAVGGEDFVQRVQNSFAQLTKTNRRKDNIRVKHALEGLNKEERSKLRKSQKGYEGFYVQFGARYFKRFIRDSIGAALLAHNNSKPIENWSVDDVRGLKAFVATRYKLLHRVIRDLGTKKLNPLSNDLTKKQLSVLMRETFRLSLYPGYKLNIRVGIGGTDDQDIRIRIPSYAMNALDVISVYEKANKSCRNVQGIAVPTLSLVSGVALGCKVNGLDEKCAHNNVKQTFAFLKGFIETYYPDVSSQVAYEVPSQERVFNNHLYGCVFNAAQEITCKDPSSVKCPVTKEKVKKLQAAHKMLSRFAAKRPNGANGNGDGAHERALKYAVAHLMPEVFGSVQQAGRYSSPVWKIGGRSERYFNAFSEIVGSLVRDNEEIYLPSAHSDTGLLTGLCTTTTVGGNPPPYYRGPEGTYDLGLSEYKAGPWEGIFSTPAILSRIQEEQSGPASDMRALLNHPRLGNGDIKQGWNKYSQFLSTCSL